MHNNLKTTQSLKDEIYRQVQTSGIFKQVQSKLKTEVLNLIDKQTNANKGKLNFQYEHPLLGKMRKFPLTSLCLDLIQEFLESFKFKYTLSVFKKQINRQSNNIHRGNLADNFGKIQLKNVQNQAVLLSIVGQIVSGDIVINQNAVSTNNQNVFAWNTAQQQQNNTRVNNFMSPNQNNQNNFPTQQQTASSTNGFTKKQNGKISDISNGSGDKSKSVSNLNLSSSSQQQASSVTSNSNFNTPSTSEIKPSQISSSNQNSQISKENVPVEEQKFPEKPKQQKGKKGGKVKKQIQKAPQEATDLMGDLMGKFKTKDLKKQEEKKAKLIQQKRAFSEEKVKKQVDQKEQGANKIRGVSAGKMSSFMSKFMNPPAQKNQSFVDQQMDQFQQSKDSTRKNPLYSSTESGFDKSGYYDQSVDSNAIEDFQYVEKAKRFSKR